MVQLDAMKEKYVAVAHAVLEAQFATVANRVVISTAHLIKYAVSVFAKARITLCPHLLTHRICF